MNSKKIEVLKYKTNEYTMAMMGIATITLNELGETEIIMTELNDKKFDNQKAIDYYNEIIEQVNNDKFQPERIWAMIEAVKDLIKRVMTMKLLEEMKDEEDDENEGYI